MQAAGLQLLKKEWTAEHVCDEDFPLERINEKACMFQSNQYGADLVCRLPHSNEF